MENRLDRSAIHGRRNKKYLHPEKQTEPDRNFDDYRPAWQQQIPLPNSLPQQPNSLG